MRLCKSSGGIWRCGLKRLKVVRSYDSRIRNKLMEYNKKFIKRRIFCIINKN